MGESPAPTNDIDRNVATNVRECRESLGLSQDELAQRMSEQGFGFTQATVWKIEQAQRSVKISEAAALAVSLELKRWTDLTAEPAATQLHVQLQSAARRCVTSYAALKTAAADFLDAQVNVSFAARQAQDAGLLAPDQTWVHGMAAWADLPAERAVLEAREEWLREDDAAIQVDEKIDAILAAMREHGHQPPNPADWITE